MRSREKKSQQRLHYDYSITESYRITNTKELEIGKISGVMYIEKMGRKNII